MSTPRPLLASSLLLCVFIFLLCGTSLLPAADLWLAVGYGGRRMISTDGKTWEITAEWSQPGGDDGNNLMAAVWGKGQFVVAGGGGGGPTGAGHILTSKDGREWTETLKDKSRINPVVFGGDRFIAGKSTYPSGTLIWSTDGAKWNDGAKIATKSYTHFRGGAYGNGVFVLTGNGKKDDKEIFWAVASPDGEKITSERHDLPGQGRIVFGGGQFVMMAGNSDVGLVQSKDGIEWLPVELPDDAKVSWLVSTGDTLLAGNGKVAFSSRDGLKWQAFDMVAKHGVAWSDGHRFITTNWPGKMMYSPDGKTWINGNELTANGINRVVKAE